jgi:hypothetical protein
VKVTAISEIYKTIKTNIFYQKYYLSDNTKLNVSLQLWDKDISKYDLKLDKTYDMYYVKFCKPDNYQKLIHVKFTSKTYILETEDIILNDSKNLINFDNLITNFDKFILEIENENAIKHESIIKTFNCIIKFTSIEKVFKYEGCSICKSQTCFCPIKANTLIPIYYLKVCL